MIDKRKIKKAAEKAALNDTFKGMKRKDYEITSLSDHERGFQEGFIEGVSWLLDNLWHDAKKEEPKPTPKYRYGYVSEDEIIWLLAITEDDEIKMMYSTHEVEYEGDDDGYWLFHDTEGDEYNPFHGEVKKWLYIDDIKRGGRITKRKEGVNMKK